MASISRKSSYKVPIIIFRCYIMGDEPIILEQFFYGFEGVIMGSIMGSQNIMGLDYGSNISDKVCNLSVYVGACAYLMWITIRVANRCCTRTWLRCLIQP